MAFGALYSVQSYSVDYCSMNIYPGMPYFQLCHSAQAVFVADMDSYFWDVSHTRILKADQIVVMKDISLQPLIYQRHES